MSFSFIVDKLLDASTEVIAAPVCVCARARPNPLLNTDPLPLGLEAFATDVLLTLSRLDEVVDEPACVDVVGVDGGDCTRNA